ncbi:DUF7673 family protein [Sinorhizobium meliloti]|uniref:DUF7673 family protein n=1 Tax=Rhizobium meliloti TaxID=382 RepID=UPI003BFA6A94
MLAWWNAEALGGFDIADLFAVDRGVSEDMATIFTYLARGGRRLRPTIAAKSKASSNAGGRRRSEKGLCHATFTRCGRSACAAAPGRVRRSGA